MSFTTTLSAVLILLSSDPRMDPKKTPDPELAILAHMIYPEANGASLKGMLAVGHVAKSRVYHEAFPDTYTAVVLQKNHFSYRLSSQRKLVRSAPVDPVSWRKAILAAVLVKNTNVKDPTHGSVFFCNPKTATAAWCKYSKASARIDGHKFVRYEHYQTKPSVKRVARK